MEGSNPGKYPAATFAAENEPFYDLLKTGNSVSQGPTTSGAPTNPVDFGENILPNYDFHPTRPAPPLSTNGSKIMSPALSEQSLDGKSSLSETFGPKHEHGNHDVVAAVERTMKKYADNLMHVLEDMRGKLTQLERTTDRLESTVSELQNRNGDNHGELDGRVRGLEHVLREVQRGVQLLRDKSELAEAQAELAKMQTTATVKPPTTVQAFPALTAPPTAEEPAKLAPQSTQLQIQVEQPALAPGPLPSAPSAPPQQLTTQVPQYQPPPQAPNHPPPPQPQPQLQIQAPPQPQRPHSQQPPYSQPPSYMPQQPPASAPPPPPTPQQPQQPQGQSGSAPPPSQYGPPAPGYMQRPPQQQQQQQQDAPPAYLPQGYGQQGGAPPHQMSPSMPPQQGPPQPGPPRQGYEGAPPQQGGPPPGGRLALPPPPGSYGPAPPSYAERPGPAGGYDRPPSASYDRPPTSGYERQGPPSFDRPPPSGYDRQSGYEPRVPASPYPPPQYGAGGGPPPPGTYPRLQMAQPVQSEPPRANAAGGPPQLSTSKMPIEQVIDDVAAMGFHKDEVRSIVRQLTETGKSVDLNIVLDTLMTRGAGPGLSGRPGW